MKRLLYRAIYGPNYLIFEATYQFVLWTLFFALCGYAVFWGVPLIIEGLIHAN